METRRVVGTAFGTVAGTASVIVLEVHVFEDWPVSALLAVTAYFGTMAWLLLRKPRPTLRERWAERKRLEAERKRLEAEARRFDGWGDILPDMERLAESLQAERLDRSGENTVLLNRNRLELGRIAKRLDERRIPHPDVWPQHGETQEWETFLWSFIHRVKQGEIAMLPTLYKDVQEAFERREYWRDPDNLLRHYWEQQGAE